MSDALSQCIELESGSRFYRGDLHIHSHSASHDVTDSEMTPQAIVATAVRENLNIIAIADHNEITNIQAALKAGSDAGILVIPAVELSTPEGHLLCYFPTYETLASFHGRLDLADRGLPNSRCRTSMHACLEIIKALDGFGILAHVDGGDGLETNDPGGSPHKVDIICHPALLAIELKNAASVVRYSPEDVDPVRIQIGKERTARLGLGERQYLARVLSSDSHTLNALGRNAAQDRRLTRYKMAKPSFGGLQLALEEGDSRIRLEDEIPTSTPFILGVSIGGGFLNNQSIHFNSNLNCIIGGRGTGKSTTFEAVRCLTGSPSDADVVDSEVWPQRLDLFWQDEAGEMHTLSRAMRGDLVNIDDPLDGPIAFEIDCFGQGEAARVREQAKADPLALMKYLDTFTHVGEAIQEEQVELDNLLKIQNDINMARKNVDAIPQTQRALTVLQQQLQAFEAAKGSEIIKLQRGLATEKALKTSLQEKLKELKLLVESDELNEKLTALRTLVDTDGIETGKTEAAEIIAQMDVFSEAVNLAKAAIKSAYTHLQKTTLAAIEDWTAKEQPLRDEVEEKRKQLEQNGVKLDMSHITKLASDEATHQKTLISLRAWEPVLKSLHKDYSEALARRWAARRKISSLRQAYAVKASKALAEVLSDLQVKLQYIDSAYSEEAVSIIATAMTWRTSNHVKARAIVEKLTIPGLLSAITKSQYSSVSDIEIEKNVKLFTTGDARDIIAQLGDPSVRAALETCHVDDLPKLMVTRRIDEGPSPKYIHRDFSRLSLGQQQSVLLALILSSDSKRPLIIDQPEDNLDSEFIFHTFVPVLRRAKERRQVIIVTHNANIAVLGDAEQLIVFKSNSETSKIVARGSIDDINARDAACKILEGAREAFTRRARIYGIS